MFVQIKNLSKVFKKNLAVDKINFHIEKNKTVGLLGPNGCGKTTSIGMMLGLIKPSEGEIIIDNKNLESFKRDEILTRINFCSPYIELPHIIYFDSSSASCIFWTLPEKESIGTILFPFLSHI